METGVFKEAKKYVLLVLLYEFLGSALMTYSYSLSSQSSGVRAAAYLIGWIIASTLSGAHFNPAVTIAVYIFERQFKTYITQLLFVILSQILGSFLGIGIAYLLAKYNSVDLYPKTWTINDGDLLYFADQDLSKVYQGRVFFVELMCTFTFVFVLLILKYKHNLMRVEDPIKGIAAALTLFCCLKFTCGAGGLNPVLGLTESLLYYGELYHTNQNVSDHAKVLWIYILAPLLGGVLAGAFTIFHHKVESLGIDVPLSDSKLSITEYRFKDSQFGDRATAARNNNNFKELQLHQICIQL